MYLLSLDEPISIDSDGDVVTLADILPSGEDMEEKVMRKIAQRALIRSIPVNIRCIGVKRLRSEALTSKERKALQRFRAKFKANHPEDISPIIYG